MPGLFPENHNEHVPDTNGHYQLHGHDRYTLFLPGSHLQYEPPQYSYGQYQYEAAAFEIFLFLNTPRLPQSLSDSRFQTGS